LTDTPRISAGLVPRPVASAPDVIEIDIAKLASHAGTALGVSSWHEITQSKVKLFADATGDHQWIHLDLERAREGPYGTTIAHGFLTLSLEPALLDEVVAVSGCSAVVNYGLNKVRFPAPVPVGSRVRMHVSLVSASERPDRGVETIFALEFEVEGGTKPCCVAESVFRYIPNPISPAGTS
jgi:acyl dehydratase